MPHGPNRSRQSISHALEWHSFIRSFIHRRDQAEQRPCVSHSHWDYLRAKSWWVTTTNVSRDGGIWWGNSLCHQHGSIVPPWSMVHAPPFILTGWKNSWEPKLSDVEPRSTCMVEQNVKVSDLNNLDGRSTCRLDLGSTLGISVDLYSGNRKTWAYKE